MGSFLEKPLTEKDTHRGDGPGLQWASSAMQGWRVNMEDAYIAQVGVDKFEKLCYFGVLDGHGGDLTSKYAGENMVQTIIEEEAFKKVTEKFEVEALSDALYHAHFTMDRKLKAHPRMSQGDTSGSTAITGFVTSNNIVIANCGDSRSVLCRGGGQAEAMSFDHKPTNEGEERRISESGGHVSMGRVNGDLAVSRALGDFVYKQASHLAPEKQAVSIEPEMKTVAREAGDEFLIFACDGIWDVKSNQQACDFVRQAMMDGITDVGTICEMLLDNCLEEGSKDNMSIVLVVFESAPFGEAKPDAEADESQSKASESSE